MTKEGMPAGNRDSEANLPQRFSYVHDLLIFEGGSTVVNHASYEGHWFDIFMHVLIIHVHTNEGHEPNPKTNFG